MENLKLDNYLVIEMSYDEVNEIQGGNIGIALFITATIGLGVYLYYHYN